MINGESEPYILREEHSGTGYIEMTDSLVFKYFDGSRLSIIPGDNLVIKCKLVEIQSTGGVIKLESCTDLPLRGNIKTE